MKKIIGISALLFAVYISFGIGYVKHLKSGYIGDGKYIDNQIQSIGIMAGECDDRPHMAYCSPLVDQNFESMERLIKEGKFTGSKDRRLRVLYQSRQVGAEINSFVYSYWFWL